MALNSEMDYACARCKTKVKLKTMRYSLNGKDLLCNECHLKEAGNVPKHKISRISYPQIEKVNYFCPSCRYNFSRAKDILVDKCPFCGKVEVVMEKRKELAQDILNKVDDLF